MKIIACNENSKIDFKEIETQTKSVIDELIQKAGLKKSDIFVIGCSTSEICGGIIGKNSNEQAGKTVVEAALSVLKPKGIFLAVQGCEHINRSLVIERAAAEKFGFQIVSVVPALHAGGACALAAYKAAEDPVMIEHVCASAGIDIGGTAIGMHIKFVQVPFRTKQQKVGFAGVLSLYHRPPLIGGQRAIYE